MVTIGCIEYVDPFFESVYGVRLHIDLVIGGIFAARIQLLVIDDGGWRDGKKRGSDEYAKCFTSYIFIAEIDATVFVRCELEYATQGGCTD
jgi:hypothetical protein